MAVQIPKIPHKLEDVLGRPGTDEFIDFLNQAFHVNKEDVVQVVSDRFDRKLVEETSKIRIEIAGVRTEMAGLRTELKTDIAGLRGELKEDIASLKGKLEGDIAGLGTGLAGLRAEMKSDIAILHRDNAVQTRWILAVFLAAGVLYPILSQLLAKFVH